MFVFITMVIDENRQNYEPTAKSLEELCNSAGDGIAGFKARRYDGTLPRELAPQPGKAVIKFDKSTITLRFGKSKISFHRIPESICKGEKGIKNDIEPIAPTMTVNRLVLEWEEKIKLHQEKEMEFDRWRNKNFKNKHYALFKIENKVDDDGEVT
ncbi:hypothetical protein Tco_1074750 [Tanacetum coccineum]